MDWRAERQALKRIIALLVALADLAERTRHTHRAMSGLVLWILRLAESAARDYVGDVPGRQSVAGRTGIDTSEAHRLAASFRALARTLQNEWEQCLLWQRDGGTIVAKAPRTARHTNHVVVRMLRRMFASVHRCIPVTHCLDTT